MGRLIALTAKTCNGQAYAKPRKIYVNDDLIKVIPANSGSGLTKVIEEAPGGSKDIFQVYEDAMHVEVLRAPSSTDVFVKQHAALGASAAGNAQGAGLAASKHLTEVTTATGGSADSVDLPAATVGLVRTIINSHASVTLDVYPASGDFIDSAAVNVGTTIAPGKRKTFVCLVADYWTTAEDFGE